MKGPNTTISFFLFIVDTSGVSTLKNNKEIDVIVFTYLGIQTIYTDYLFQRNKPHSIK